MKQNKPVIAAGTIPREEYAKAEKTWRRAIATIADRRAAGLEDPNAAWLGRIKAARESYLAYLDIAEWAYAFASAFVRQEKKRIEKELLEIDGTGLFARSESHVPQPRVPREALKDVIRASQYLLDQGEAFERYHRRDDDGSCLECGKKIGPGKRKYCSRKCTVNYLQRRHRAKVWKCDMNKYREKYRVDILDSAKKDPAPLLPPPAAKSRRKV